MDYFLNCINKQSGQEYQEEQNASVVMRKLLITLLVMREVFRVNVILEYNFILNKKYLVLRKIKTQYVFK